METAPIAGPATAAGLGLWFLLIAALGFAMTIFWLWMLVDCLMHEPSQGNDKLIWALVILLTNWIGALVYFFVRRPRRKAASGR